MRDFLINEDNVKLMGVKENIDFNVKRLLNNNKLDQSQSIRFGKIFENFIKSLIKSKGYKLINEELIDVYGTGSKTNKGKKDLDICFIKDDNIFYFESKLNLNLDSEKSKATDDKISEITDYLITENKDISVFSGLITCWWEKEEGMSITTKTNLLFMKDFLELLDIKSTKEEYYTMMSDFGKMI
jgi:hypothetical protein